MITNLVILSSVLLTNSQQAIIGEAGGKALVASQETIVQRTITLEDIVLSSRVSTNAIGFAFQRPPESSTVQALPSPPSHLAPTNLPSEHLKTDAIQVLNTNSPAYKRRMKLPTNAQPEQDPRK